MHPTSGSAKTCRYLDKRDGRWYRRWRLPGSRRVYGQIESRWIWESINGPIPEGHDVHHKDRDHSNNDPSNLECMPELDHHNIHDREREHHALIDGVVHRECAKCREWKRLDMFSIRRAGTYHGYCKQCAIEYVREWRRANPDKRKKHVERYAERHPRIYVRGPYKKQPKECPTIPVCQ